MRVQVLVLVLARGALAVLDSLRVGLVRLVVGQAYQRAHLRRRRRSSLPVSPAKREAVVWVILRRSCYTILYSGAAATADYTVCHHLATLLICANSS